VSNLTVNLTNQVGLKGDSIHGCLLCSSSHSKSQLKEDCGAGSICYFQVRQPEKKAESRPKS
jgi:hypothetical protein